ncbi:MAG: hypothetical protein ACOYMB_00120 [Patescibacteria group bacterium]
MQEILTGQAMKELKIIFPDQANAEDLKKLEKFYLSKKIEVHVAKTKTHLTYSIEISTGEVITLIK